MYKVLVLLQLTWKACTEKKVSVVLVQIYPNLTLDRQQIVRLIEARLHVLSNVFCLFLIHFLLGIFSLFLQSSVVALRGKFYINNCRLVLSEPPRHTA